MYIELANGTIVNLSNISSIVWKKDVQKLNVRHVTGWCDNISNVTAKDWHAIKAECLGPNIKARKQDPSESVS